LTLPAWRNILRRFGGVRQTINVAEKQQGRVCFGDKDEKILLWTSTLWHNSINFSIGGVFWAVSVVPKLKLIQRRILMNKKLLAFAVAAAFVAPLAASAEGNVTIYGIMDVSYDRTDNGLVSTNKISSNSSRLGFKGTEDLGNGTSAVWQIESQINADGTTNGTTMPGGGGMASSNGGTSIGGRDTFAGLTGGWGTAIMGRHDTPYKIATRSLDYFADGLADNRNVMGQNASHALGVSGFSFDGRQSDVLAYISPTMSGFTGAIGYVAGAEAATTGAQNKGDAWSVAGLYGNGPLFASLAYERHNIGDATTGSIAAAGFGNLNESAWKLGLGYKVDALQIGFAYEKMSDNFGAGGNDLLDHHAYTLGGKYSMGSNDIKLAYTASGDLGSAANSGAKQWAVGLDHNMSKRTKVYVQYVRLNNDSAANFSLNGAGATGSVTATAGNDPSAWSLGMRHSF
jgi:predicted porin